MQLLKFGSIFVILTLIPAGQSYGQSRFLEAVELGAGGAEVASERIQYSQSIQENNRREIAHRERELSFIIANDYTLLRHFKLGDPTDTSQPLYGLDVVSAYLDDPHLTLRIFGGYSTSTFFVRDRRGKLMQVRPISISPINVGGVEKFRVEFDRAQGRGPLYWNDETIGERNAIAMRREELDRVASRRLALMASYGALEPIVARLNAIDDANYSSRADN